MDNIIILLMILLITGCTDASIEKPDIEIVFSERYWGIDGGTCLEIHNDNNAGMVTNTFICPE